MPALSREAATLAAEIDLLCSGRLGPAEKLRRLEEITPRWEAFSRHVAGSCHLAAGTYDVSRTGPGGHQSLSCIAAATRAKAKGLAQTHKALAASMESLRNEALLIEAADWAEAGRYDEVLRLCQPGLRLSPQRSADWRPLLAAGPCGDALARELGELLEDCRFDLLWTRAVPEILQFGGITTHPAADGFLASDKQRGAVVRLGPGGRFRACLPVSVLQPRDLAVDAQGLVWICDFGGRKLVSSTLEGRTRLEVSLPEVLGDDVISCPLMLCVQGDELVVRVTDSSTKRNRLVAVAAKPPHAARLVRELRGVEPGLGADCLGKCLDGSCESLYARLAGQASFLEGRGDIGPMLQFLRIGNAYYLNCKTHIVKMSLTGSLIYSADIGQVLALPDAKVGWLHGWMEDDGGRLVATLKNAPTMALFRV